MPSSYRVKVERQADVARNMHIFVTLLFGRAKKNRTHFLTMSAILAPPPKKTPSAMMTLVLHSKIKNKEQEHVCSFPYIFPSPEHTPV